MVQITTGLDPHRLKAIEGVNKGHLKILTKTKKNYPHHDLPTLLACTGYKTIISGQTYGWEPDLIGYQEKLALVNTKEILGWKNAAVPSDRKATKDDVVYPAEDASLKLAKRIKELDEPFFATWMCRSSMYGLFAKDEDIERYQKPVKVLAQERYERLMELGLIDKSWPWKNPITDKDEGVVGSKNATIFTDTDLIKEPNWKPGYGLKGVRQPKDFAELMAVYAAQTNMLDRSVGHLLKALDEKGIRDNTIIIFIVLQGADAHNGSKGTTWAKLNAIPFTGRRRTTYSGGISTPAILSWPAKISAKAKGSINHSISSHSDWMPTILEASKTNYPDKDKQGRDILKLDGKSLLPVLKGEHISTTLGKPLYLEILGRKAVITDEWKWLKEEKGPGKLYNMKTDRLETKDVAADNPELAEKMRRLFNKWGDEVGAHRDSYGGDEKTRKKAAGFR